MTSSRTAVRFAYETHTLDNGLRVVLQPDRSSPLVSVHVMYHVGSADERPGRTGFAHLFEHLLFQGSAHVGEAEHFRLVQEAGGTLNGTTWFDRTNYFETVPAGRLDLALWLEADRMGWFLPAISQEKLDNQREVVKNERRQSYENRPYGLATETVLAAAFPGDHPYAHPTIGYMEDIDRATLEDVSGFFREWYGPANATLVLCGDFEATDALRRIDRYFGEIEGGKPPPRRAVDPPSAGAEDVLRLPDRVSVPRVYAMYHAPGFRSRSWEATTVLSSVLAGGRSSRLYRELVYEQGVAADVHAYAWPLERSGMLWVVATARPGVGAAALQAGIDATLESAARDGLREEEVEGARNRAGRQLVAGLSPVGRRADALAHATVLRGDPGYVNESFDRFAAVQREDLDRLGGEILTERRRTVLHVIPLEKDDGEAAGGGDQGEPRKGSRPTGGVV